MSTISLELRDRIETFLVAYCHTLDDGNWDRWPDYFTEQAQYKILTRENYEAGLRLGIMFCDGRGMMKDRMLALQTANIYEPHTYCHMLSRSGFVPGATGASSNAHDVDQTQGQAIVRVRTNFTVIRTMQSGATELFAVGKYIDEMVLLGDAVLLRSRTVVLDSRRVDILLVAPL